MSKDFNDFLRNIDVDKLEYDVLHEIHGSIMGLQDDENTKALLRIMHGTVKAYLRAYHQFLFEESDA